MLDLHLQAIVEARHRTADLHDVSALKFLRDARIAGIPNARLDLPRLVAQDQIQIWLVGLGRSLLLVQHQEKCVEVPALFERRQIGNIDILHAAGKHTATGKAHQKPKPMRESGIPPLQPT